MSTSETTTRHDLFDHGRADWHADPRSAFDALDRRAELQEVVRRCLSRAMGPFPGLAWRRNAPPCKPCSVRSIETIRCATGIRKPQRVRYLRLIERVLDHVREIELASTNPARFHCPRMGRPAWEKRPRQRTNGFLTHGERAALLAHLFSPLDNLPNLTKGQRWRERRVSCPGRRLSRWRTENGEAAALTVSCYRLATTVVKKSNRAPLRSRARHDWRLLPSPCSTFGSASEKPRDCKVN